MTNEMPNSFLYSAKMCFVTYFLAGGVGSFFTNFALKILVTSVSLLVASRFVQRYKEWVEKNPMNVSEFKRFYLFIKAGFKKNIKDYCEDDETN